MKDIYISYSHSDRTTAELIRQGLQEAGFEVWWDRDLRAGERWRDVIGQAISDARVVIALMSPDFVQSEWVRAESQQALDENKLIPVKIRDVMLPLGFSHIQYIDLTNWNAERSHPGWQLLLRSVTNLNPKLIQQEPQPDTPGAPIIVEPGRRYKKASGASTCSIFLAHASADKPKLKPILEVLLDQGFRLWIDKPQ